MESNEMNLVETATEEVATTCSKFGTKNLVKGAGIAAAIAGVIGLAAAGGALLYNKIKKSKEEQEESAFDEFGITEEDFDDCESYEG